MGQRGGIMNSSRARGNDAMIRPASEYAFATGAAC
jgi:hypothetical protein